MEISVSTFYNKVQIRYINLIQKNLALANVYMIWCKKKKYEKIKWNENIEMVNSSTNYKSVGKVQLLPKLPRSWLPACLADTSQARLERLSARDYCYYY